MVVEGQPIGEASGFVSVPIHSPISGKVVAIESRQHPAGYTCQSVIIEASKSITESGSEAEAEAAVWRIPGYTPDYHNAEPEALKNIIKAAGIVGMGGAAFPSHVKLSPPPEKPIDTLIINGVECEPFLTCDHRTMLEEPEAIYHGVMIVRRILGVTRAIIGVENNKLDALQTLKSTFAQVPGVEVVGCAVKYPQGGEKQLIKALTGREVPPPPGLPMDVGVVVQNVGTVAAIARAVMEGLPLIERVVTISGSMINNPENVRVKIGTPLSVLIQACGGLKGEPGKVVMGGPMMGIAQFDMDVPVVKSTSGFLFFARDELPNLTPSPCIRCGRCTMACPMGLIPGDVARRIELGMLEEAERFHLKECMECGACSFVCPSNRWLVQLFRIGKAKLNERKSQSR